MANVPAYKRNRLARWLFIGPAMLWLLAVTIYPTLYSLYVSFFEYNLAQSKDIQGFVWFNNYRDVLTDDRFWTATRFTFIYSSAGLAVQLGLGFLLALIFYQSRLKGIITTLLIIPMGLSPIATGLLWRVLFNANSGLVNYGLTTELGMDPINWLGDTNWARVAIIVADAWQWTPFMYLILMAGLQSLPHEPLEAAAIDGANYAQRLRYIVIPMLRPLISLAVLLRLMDMLKLFDVIFTLTNAGPGTSTETLSFLTYQTGFRYFGMGQAAAMAYILLIAMSVLVLIFLRPVRRELASKSL